MAETTPIIVEPPQNLMQRNGKASVTTGVGYSFPFGNGKVMVSITLTCDQDQETIERAGEAAVTLARHLGMQYMETVAKDLATGVGQLESPLYEAIRG